MTEAEMDEGGDCAAWIPGVTRVHWDLCGAGTFVEWLIPYSFARVRFDNGVPREYSFSNPCLAMAKDLTVIEARDA